MGRRLVDLDDDLAELLRVAESAQGIDRQLKGFASGDRWLTDLADGRIAFAGDTVSDTIAAILEREPDWTALSADTPPAFMRVLKRCLTKDAAERLRDIGDARIEIDSATDAPEPEEEPPGSRARFHGLRAGGQGRSKLAPPMANSQVESLPRTTRAARIRRRLHRRLAVVYAREQASRQQVR